MRRASHWWFVYDPADLGKVAQGLKQQWEIQPRNTWKINYPGMPNPLPGWADEPRNMITGVTYDAATKQLFVAVRFGYSTGGAGENGHTVYVYRVNEPPPAGVVTVGGRVTTATGRGVASARLTLTDANNAARIVLMNGVGFYRFADVTVGATYTITARHKRHFFSPPQRIFTASENVADLNFSAI